MKAQGDYCPKCFSILIEFYIPAGMGPGDYVCSECHYEWSADPDFYKGWKIFGPDEEIRI